MSIFNDYYPKDYYEKDVPIDIKEKVWATAIVCAVGQKFLDYKNGSLVTKTSGFYYKNDDPQYPFSGEGNLCKDIANETAVWMTGTAFAIGRNTWITAGHVTEDVLNEVDSNKEDFKKLRLMLGYFRKSSPDSPFDYKMYEVTSIKYSNEKDISIITTKESVANYFDVEEVPQLRNLRDDDAILMVGYPLGQTFKLSEGYVAEVDGNLDSFKGYISFFPGYSGSPVISRKTGKVVGLLTAGSKESNEDWVEDGCYYYKRYPNEEEYYAEIVYANHFKF